MRSRKTTVGIIWFLLLHLSMISPSIAQAAPSAPYGPHCIGSGPLPLNDPNFCGCTWGEVYYRGQPVNNAEVSLQFGAQITHTLVAQPTGETAPYYDLTGAKLGAKRNDVMTVTVEFAGQTVTRAFRAQPDSQGEQQINLALPEQGVWTPWLTGGYTRALLMNGATLWAGGAAGLLAINVTNGISTTQLLPWTDPAVIGVTSASNGHLWVGGPHTLAEFDGVQWQNRPTPFAVPLRTLLIHPTTGALWVGGGDNSGALAVYDGAWHTVNGIPKPVTTLVVDSIGNLWAGTDGGGLYRHAGNNADVNSGWTHFTVNDGLASDYILAAAASGNQVWFGAQPYLSSQGARGGISRYNLADNTWRVYTTAHGLPADRLLQDATAPIYALAVDAQGTPWAGTLDGVYRLATATFWTRDFATGGDPVQALATGGNLVGAGQAKGQINYLDLKFTPGKPPTAQIALTSPTITRSGTLILTAKATDQDENANPNNPQIVAWDWRLAGDNPLCTTAVCQVSGQTLSPGVYTIGLRVQDDEGVWSALATTQVTVTEGAQVYLPFVKRPGIAQR